MTRASIAKSFLTLLALCVTASKASPAAVTTYSIYPGVDQLSQGDLVEINGLTETGCLQACNSNSRCVGYVFAPYGLHAVLPTQCFLKDAIDPDGFQFATVQPLTLGLKATCGEFITPSPLCFEVIM